MGKGIINFTRGGNFKEFNNLVKNYLVKHKSSKVINIIDYIYPLTELKHNSYEITNHINLSGYNPLIGPQFISLTNIYVSSNGIVAVGLKDNLHPNSKEKQILLKNGVKAYCYNLIPTVIFAASLGLKVRATGIVKET